MYIVARSFPRMPLEIETCLRCLEMWRAVPFNQAVSILFAVDTFEFLVDQLKLVVAI